MRVAQHSRVLATFLPCVALALALLACTAAAGPSGSWQRISPPTQTGAATAYDSSRQLMYVFGGDGSSVLHAASTAGPPTEWADLKTTGTPPAARSGAELAYDPAGDRLIVFGGQDYAGHFYNDIWQLTLSGTPTWSAIAATGSVPKPRSSFGSCFDAARRLLVVFGGLDSTGTLLSNHVFQIDLGQPSPAWSDWGPDGNTPTARYGAGVCDDPANDGMIVFGGDDGGTNRVDVHTMSYGSHAWTSIAASGDVPPGTSSTFVTYDADDTLLFVWGGAGSDDNVRTLSPGTGTWTIRPNNNWQAGPSPHLHPVGIWVPGAHQFLVLDGNTSNQLFDFFYNSPTDTYWQNWQDPGSLSEPRSGATLVFDRPDDVAMLFGGLDDPGQPVSSWWAYSLGLPRGWSQGFFTCYGGSAPSPRSMHTVVWDDKRDRMLVFGGQDGSYARLNDLYELDVANLFSPGVPGYYWNTITPAGTPPSPRFGAASVYDPVGDRMIVIGGSDASGYPRGDLWQLALAGTPTWSRVASSGGPSGRYGHTAIYDAYKRRVIVFAGEDSLLLSPANDVWALQLPGMTWTHLSPTGTAPPARLQHTAVFDSRRERMLVFGGEVSGGDARDTWELTLSGATPAWTKLAPTTTVLGLPYTRYLHAAVYDSTGDRMMVFGGVAPPIGIFGNPFPLDDFWSLQFDFSGSLAAVGTQQPVAELAVGLPSPNPARGATRLSYTLGHDAHVRAEIYDLAGRRIVTLEDGLRTAGPHELSWDGRGISGSAAASGLYFYRIQAAGHTATRKLLLVR